MSTNLYLINKNKILIPKLNKKIRIVRKKSENTKISTNIDINKLHIDKQQQQQILNFKSFSTMSLGINNLNSNNKIETNKKPNTSINEKKPIHILPKINSNKLIKVLSMNSLFEYNKNDESGVIYDINNYKNISINLLVADKELANMFEEIYKRKDFEIKKKWIDINLFNREVFKIRLESCIKKKLDVTSFIKSEINKILNNKLLDHIFLNSYKQGQLKYEEHIKNINNLYS